MHQQRERAVYEPANRDSLSRKERNTSYKGHAILSKRKLDSYEQMDDIGAFRIYQCLSLPSKQRDIVLALQKQVLSL